MSVPTAVDASAGRMAEQAARRLAPRMREGAGWAVAMADQQTWRRDVALQRTARAAALLYPSVTDRLVTEARSRGIEVIRDDAVGPDRTTAI